MLSLAEAATLLSYGYFAYADGRDTGKATDHLSASPQQLAAALVMDLVIHERLRLEQPYVLGRLKKRRRSYRRIIKGIAVLWLILILALFFVPLFVFTSSFPALADNIWASAAYVGIYFGVVIISTVLLSLLVGRPLHRRLSGKMELVEFYDPDDLRHLTIQHMEQVGQKKPTFDYVRYAFTGRELRELREKLKQQLIAQECVVEQERPESRLLRRMGIGEGAVNREHPVWLALREQFRALILERRVMGTQTAALAILLSARRGPDLGKQSAWTVGGIYQCFAPHEYSLVAARCSDIIACRDAAITAAIGAERYDALLAIRAITVSGSPDEL